MYPTYVLYVWLVLPLLIICQWTTFISSSQVCLSLAEDVTPPLNILSHWWLPVVSLRPLGELCRVLQFYPRIKQYSFISRIVKICFALNFIFFVRIMMQPHWFGLIMPSNILALSTRKMDQHFIPLFSLIEVVRSTVVILIILLYRTVMFSDGYSPQPSPYIVLDSVY